MFFRDKMRDAARGLSRGGPLRVLSRARAGLRGLIRARLLLYLLGAAAGALLLSACGLTLAAAPASPGSSETVVFEVPQGAGTMAIATSLEQQGLIRDRLQFRLLTRVLGWAGKLKAGRYELSPGQSTWEIIGKLGRGEVRTVAVTVPEGYSLAQILRLLSDRGYGSEESLREALARLDSQGEMPFLPDSRRAFIETYEGLLFPDTYFFAEGVSGETVLRTMARRTTKAFTPEMLARAEELGLTPFQVLTMASIIEKEAMVAEERPLVSSVYHNRLRIRMKLDACPTVRYVLNKPPSERLLWVDLEVNSPYNTYIHAGLPPGPICSPGQAAIEAALYPAETRYYYFVSKNDGTHHFSRTFEEHIRASNLYQGGN